MYSSIRKFSLVISASILLSFCNYPSLANAPKTNCYIRVDNPHISKSLKRTKGVTAVKVNARSKCDKAMSDLTLYVEIYKVGFFRNELVNGEKREVLGYISPNKIIKNFRTYEECTSSKVSKYFGKAYATAFIDGRKFSTPFVWSRKTVSLPCGT